MKFSEKWLRQWINPSLAAQALADQLTMAGLEVASVTPSANQDNIFEVELTPNRGDCLSIKGIAREVAGLNQIPLIDHPIKAVAAVIQDTFPIEIQAPAECPRYVGRMIRGIKPGVSSPEWLQDALTNADIRSIHPVVDILNYVMLEIGQPMHAFDASTLSGKIVVRLALSGEQVLLLDGKTQTLQADTLVIADNEKVLAIAGIMGGETSSVKDHTTDIFLESALFTSELIAGKGRKYGMHTDSQYRFERGVDSELQTQAIERATDLILQICGGKPGPIQEVVKETLPKRQDIAFNPANVQRLLGVEVPTDTIASMLQSLGCSVKQSSEQVWLVTPPSYRYDMNIEEDFIEEVARLIGYNHIPAHLPTIRLDFIGQSETEVTPHRLKRLLVDLGYQEVITYSFVDDQLQKQLFPNEQALALLNPISSDMGVMRVSLWPSLLTVLQYNQNRQQHRMRIFEVGTRYYFRNEELLQEPVISALACGTSTNEHWSGKPTTLDFYDVKRNLESVWQLLGYSQPLTFVPYQRASCCHPGQTAQILWQGKEVGILGRLHPELEMKLDVQGPVFLFELKLEPLLSKPLPQFQRPSKFPEIRRDIAVIVDQNLPAEELISFVRKSAGEILQNVTIFDVYTGKGVDPGRKSIALGLILQHYSRTLVDQEVDNLVQHVVSGLEKEFGAKLRE